MPNAQWCTLAFHLTSAMSGNVKSVFSIRDLENLSGIKTHTIRMWERRYGLLSPSRTDSNTRYYDLANLQKLLNVVVLLKYGFKVSRLGAMKTGDLDALVREVRSEKYDKNHLLHRFKLAMMTFDQRLFMDAYDESLKDRSFREVFFKYFIPLLDAIGVLWQTRTINPAHEHFISNLIRLKIVANTNPSPQKTGSGDRVYALFLPLGEIHELGLLYLNYELVSHGHRTIYLGENLPVGSLEPFKAMFGSVTFITYATVAPTKAELSDYLDRFASSVLQPGCELWVLGAMVHGEAQPSHRHIRFFDSLNKVLDLL